MHAFIVVIYLKVINQDYTLCTSVFPCGNCEYIIHHVYTFQILIMGNKETLKLVRQSFRVLVCEKILNIS